MSILFALVLASAQPVRIGDDGFRIGEAIIKAVLSPDGHTFAVAGEGGGFHLMDARTGVVHHSWNGLPQIEDLAFDASGHLLALDQRGWLRTVDIRRCVCLREALVLDSEMIPVRGYIIAGRYVSTNAPQPILHEIATGRTVPVENPVETFPGAASSDGRWLACWTKPPRMIRDRPNLDRNGPHGLLIQDLRMGQEIRFPNESQDSFESLAFHPSRAELFVRVTGTPMILDLETRQFRTIHLEGFADALGFQTIWSPDGRKLARLRRFGLESCAIEEWDTATGRLLRSQPLPDSNQDRLAYTTDDPGFRPSPKRQRRESKSPSLTLRARTVVHTGPRASSRSRTLLWINSRTWRNSSGGISFGSGICQSTRNPATTSGHSSPQPIVTAASNSLPLNSSKPLESWADRS